MATKALNSLRICEVFSVHSDQVIYQCLLFAYENRIFFLFEPCWPVSVAQSEARSTGDQEVAASIPAGSGKIISWRLIMKYF